MKENQIQNKVTQELSWNYNGVIGYVDYSTKYGLGYMLSNHNYGVYFNDSSLLYFQNKDQ